MLLAIAAVLAPAALVARQRPVNEQPKDDRHFVTRRTEIKKVASISLSRTAMARC